MAEFCEECWKEMFEGAEEEGVKYVLSKHPELCEGCGKYKPVVVDVKGVYYYNGIKFPRKPWTYICIPLYFIFRVICLPYLIYKAYKQKEQG